MNNSKKYLIFALTFILLAGAISLGVARYVQVVTAGKVDSAVVNDRIQSAVEKQRLKDNSITEARLDSSIKNTKAKVVYLRAKKPLLDSTESAAAHSYYSDSSAQNVKCDNLLKAKQEKLDNCNNEANNLSQALFDSETLTHKLQEDKSLLNGAVQRKDSVNAALQKKAERTFVEKNGILLGSGGLTLAELIALIIAGKLSAIQQ